MLNNFICSLTVLKNLKFLKIPSPLPVTCRSEAFMLSNSAMMSSTTVEKSWRRLLEASTACTTLTTETQKLSQSHQLRSFPKIWRPSRVLFTGVRFTEWILSQLRASVSSRTISTSSLRPNSERRACLRAGRRSSIGSSWLKRVMRVSICSCCSSERQSALLITINGRRLKRRPDSWERENGPIRITDCKKTK